LDTWLPLHYDTKQNQTLDEILSRAMRKMLGETSEKPVKTSKQDQQNFNKYRHHVVSDKSIADCVEAIIGAYLISSGAQAALRIMNWFGLEVLPKVKSEDGSELYADKIEPNEPIIKNLGQLEYLTDGFDEFEEKIGYRFRNKAYLLQAFTHASYYFNELTDCYQRLEFLGDAILDYLITRYLYEDPKKHSPGELTDLRSSLVNNNIFAHLAVKFEFYKYFKYLSPSIFTIIENYIKNFNENDLDEDLIDYLYEDDDDEFMEHGPKDDLLDDYEELEVPKCLGDIFESVAGAIFLDSKNSFDTVWRVFYALMKPYIDKYTEKVPKSPIRELLEMEPETVKFEKPERTIDGKIRVTVSVFGKGKFKGIGRSYRIAKNAAAKSALKYIKKEDL
jgi:endoribonuclease Dicer